MGRDLFTSPYGRFYHLALHLAERGHDVDLWLFSYRWRECQFMQNGSLTIRSMNFWSAFSYRIPGLIRLARSLQPDWVVGFSDTYYGIFATYIAKKSGARSLIDAYDNYESYMPLAFPLHWLWQRSLRAADRITCAGPSLLELLKSDTNEGKITVIPMTADDAFHRSSNEKKVDRARFNLPVGKKLVGYHGSISRNRDIHILFSAMEQLQQQDKNILLVLSGRLDKTVKLPAHAIYSGYLRQELVPDFILCFDLLVITNKPSRFGNYSYPVKLYEALASKVPVIASRTASSEWILKDCSQLLVEPGDADQLARKIKEILASPVVDYPQQVTWKDLAVSMEKCLQM